MTITRRTFLGTTLAAGATLSLPSIVYAQGFGNSDTVTWAISVPTIFDPYSTTSLNTTVYALGVYDMLFALDSNLTPQPQMVDTWSVSDDQLTYTFELRDGLNWHDNTPVTAVDCVASLKRWLQTPGGAIVNERVDEVSAIDDATFVITLNEPLAVLIEQLAQIGSYSAFMLREQDAQNSPSTPITTYIGSGPFKFNEALHVPGVSITFDRNEDYVPRDEAPDGLAGGKVAHVSRVIWTSLPDPQTAVAALQAGEVDLMTEPPSDLHPIIESDPGLALENLTGSGFDFILRMNHLHAPFDNVKVRQAVLHLISQDAFLQVVNPSQVGNQHVISLFGTRSQYANDTNTGWFKPEGDRERAAQLLQESGYAGETVVILDNTTWTEVHNAALFLAEQLRGIGMTVELASSDGSGVTARRSSKEPVENGGWGIFMTSLPDFSLSTPISAAYAAMSGENGWFGWPKSDEYEALRAQWPNVIDPAEREAVTREMQQIWWDNVGWVYLGQAPNLTGYRKELTGLMGSPAGGLLMWNMRKA